MSEDVAIVLLGAMSIEELITPFESNPKYTPFRMLFKALDEIYWSVVDSELLTIASNSSLVSILFPG